VTCLKCGLPAGIWTTCVTCVWAYLAELLQWEVPEDPFSPEDWFNGKGGEE
jgi:hypothetical protein